MIGQCLLNKNKNVTVLKSKNFSDLNKSLSHAFILKLRSNLDIGVGVVSNMHYMLKFSRISFFLDKFAKRK